MARICVRFQPQTLIPRVLAEIEVNRMKPAVRVELARGRLKTTAASTGPNFTPARSPQKAVGRACRQKMGAFGQPDVAGQV